MVISSDFLEKFMKFSSFWVTMITIFAFFSFSYYEKQVFEILWAFIPRISPCIFTSHKNAKFSGIIRVIPHLNREINFWKNTVYFRCQVSYTFWEQKSSFIIKWSKRNRMAKPLSHFPLLLGQQNLRLYWNWEKNRFATKFERFPLIWGSYFHL